MTDLTGKSAIITGASRGIGAAAARALAAAGAAVVLAARSAGEISQVANEIEAAGCKAKAVACDVTSLDDVSAMVSACKDAFGSVDILVNNAGGAARARGDHPVRDMLHPRALGVNDPPAEEAAARIDAEEPGHPSWSWSAAISSSSML